MKELTLHDAEARLFSVFYEDPDRSLQGAVNKRIFAELWDALLRSTFEYSSAIRGLK